jgi:hypothetical protein
MKLREITAICLKARLYSWLTISTQGAMIPCIEGTPVIVAVYANGRRIEPAPVETPDHVPDNWGPDGPINPPEQGNTEA